MKLLALLFSLLTIGCTSTWVRDVQEGADGTSVTVIQYHYNHPPDRSDISLVFTDRKGNEFARIRPETIKPSFQGLVKTIDVNRNRARFRLDTKKPGGRVLTVWPRTGQWKIEGTAPPEE